MRQGAEGSIVDDSATRLRWLVACSGYRWSSRHELIGPHPDTEPYWYWMKRARRGPWLLEPVPEGAQFEARVYEPLRWNRNLHVEFARLPLGSDEQSLDALADFASRYGTLGWATAAVMDRSGESESDRSIYHAEHLLAWGRAISSVRGLLELVQACKRRDIELLRHHVRWHGRPHGVQLVYRWPGAESETYVTIAQEEPAIAARKLAEWSASTSDVARYVAPVEHYLYTKINEHLREHTALFVTKAEGGRVRVDSLLGAFYVMLAEQLSGTWKMNRCESCGKLFVPRSRTDQKTCSDACRQRMSRQRRQAEARQ